MSELHAVELLIRISIGAVMILFGLSQMVAPKRWLGYVPWWLDFLLPMPSRIFMRLHGLGNLVLGTLLAGGWWPLIIGYVAAGWWFSILPFALAYDMFIGLRDAVIICAICAYLILLHS